MKEFTITVEGATRSDIEQAAEEVLRLIRRDMLSGFNSNETGSFSFDSTGDYEPDEFICSQCGEEGGDIEDEEGRCSLCVQDADFEKP